MNWWSEGTKPKTSLDFWCLQIRCKTLFAYIPANQCLDLGWYEEWLLQGCEWGAREESVCWADVWPSSRSADSQYIVKGGWSLLHINHFVHSLISLSIYSQFAFEHSQENIHEQEKGKHFMLRLACIAVKYGIYLWKTKSWEGERSLEVLSSYFFCKVLYFPKDYSAKLTWISNIVTGFASVWYSILKHGSWRGFKTSLDSSLASETQYLLPYRFWQTTLFKIFQS